MTRLSGVKLLIPSYTKGKNQLSKKEVGESRRLVGVHVEQVIRKLIHFIQLQQYHYL